MCVCVCVCACVHACAVNILGVNYLACLKVYAAICKQHSTKD